MPWTEAQLKLFRAAAHNPDIARKHGLSMRKAREMSTEGAMPDKSKSSKRKKKKSKPMNGQRRKAMASVLSGRSGGTY